MRTAPSLTSSAVEQGTKCKAVQVDFEKGGRILNGQKAHSQALSLFIRDAFDAFPWVTNGVLIASVSRTSLRPAQRRWRTRKSPPTA